MASCGLSLIVDTFLVSCRALSRGVEDALWSAMLQRAHDHHMQRLEAEYIRTEKNAIVASLYDRLGLCRVRENGGVINYVLEPVKTMKPPSWISLNNH